MHVNLLLNGIKQLKMCSPPSSYERHFKKEHPLLYKYLKEAPVRKVSISLGEYISAAGFLAVSLSDVL